MSLTSEVKKLEAEVEAARANTALLARIREVVAHAPLPLMSSQRDE